MVNPLSEKRPRGPWHWTGHAAEARHHWLPQTPLPHLAAAAKGSPLPLAESASCNNPAQAAWAVEALLKLTHKHRLETGQRKKAAGRGLSLLKGCQAFKQEPCGQYLGRKQEGLASGDHTRQVCAPHCWSSVLTCAKVMKIHFFQGTSCQKLRGATTTDTTGTVETCGTVSWVQSLWLPVQSWKRPSPPNWVNCTSISFLYTNKICSSVEKKRQRIFSPRGCL